MATVEAELCRLEEDDAAPASRRDVAVRLIRLMDVAIAIGALLFFLPSLLLSASVVRAQDGGPALFVRRASGGTVGRSTA